MEGVYSKNKKVGRGPQTRHCLPGREKKIAAKLVGYNLIRTRRNE